MYVCVYICISVATKDCLSNIKILNATDVSCTYLVYHVFVLFCCYALKTLKIQREKKHKTVERTSCFIYSNGIFCCCLLDLRTDVKVNFYLKEGKKSVLLQQAFVFIEGMKVTKKKKSVVFGRQHAELIIPSPLFCSGARILFSRSMHQFYAMLMCMFDVLLMLYIVQFLQFTSLTKDCILKLQV